MNCGERIRAARKIAGLSQQNLADHVPVTKQSISKYERDEAMPGSEVLLAIAGTLNVPVDFFLRGRPMPPLTEPAYRAHHSKLRKRDLDSVQAQVREWLERYLELEQILPRTCQRKWSLPPHLPRAIRDLEESELAAETLREEWELGDDPIESMVEVLEDRGGKVMDLDGPKGFDGLAFWAEKTPVIVYSSEAQGDRQRFSMAHELAHLLLEPGEDGDAEKVANRFAGAFLLPERRLIAEIGEDRSNLGIRELQILKHKYGMSMQAIIYRAYDLEVISDHVRKKLFRTFSARGWRKEEPGQPVRRETPVRMEQMAAMLLAEDALSRSRVAELLGRDVQAVETTSGADDDITAGSR